jgi:hypothetical protein
VRVISGTIGRLSWWLVGFAALVSGCSKEEKVDFVTVRVLTDGQNCIVFSQQIRCDAVASYLKDNRHLPLSHDLLVMPEGAGRASLARGNDTKESLAALGYTQVMMVGFLTEPGHPDAQP